jgi:hypothetical protein
MMDTIEEAFDAAHLRHHALRNLRPGSADKCPLCADNRALALAIEATAYRLYAEEGGTHSQVETAHLDFVAQIEALGD